MDRASVAKMITTRATRQKHHWDNTGDATRNQNHWSIFFSGLWCSSGQSFVFEHFSIFFSWHTWTLNNRCQYIDNEMCVRMEPNDSKTKNNNIVIYTLLGTVRSWTSPSFFRFSSPYLSLTPESIMIWEIYCRFLVFKNFERVEASIQTAIVILIARGLVACLDHANRPMFVFQFHIIT